MKILYITVRVPWGQWAAYILEELFEVKRQGVDLLIIPRNPPKEVFHKEAKEILEDSIWLPLINLRMVIVFLKLLLTSISLWKILGIVLIHSQNPWILIKNLIVFPKGVFVAETIKGRNIGHIHAHWGSTTATMAYVISRITEIPWSFTLHRWDIKENNMLKEKVKSAKFVRCISRHGKNELLEIIGKKWEEKINMVHMGVKIPETSELKEKKENLEKFTIVTPANLIEVKGHQYLIEACLILVKRDIRNFQCIFYGEGKLKIKLENFIRDRKLTDYIKMPGAIPHKKLIEMYRNKEVDAVVLPSITTNKGEHEGIPVSLMEAMAYKIPVISTNIGGIPELLLNNAGIIVKEKSSEELTKAILKLMKEEDFKKEISENGYRKVEKEFNIEQNVKTLLELIQQSL